MVNCRIGKVASFIDGPQLENSLSHFRYNSSKLIQNKSNPFEKKLIRQPYGALTQGPRKNRGENIEMNQTAIFKNSGLIQLCG